MGEVIESGILSVVRDERDESFTGAASEKRLQRFEMGHG